MSLLLNDRILHAKLKINNLLDDTRFRNSIFSYLLFTARQASSIQVLRCFFIILTKFCLFGSIRRPVQLRFSSKRRVLLSASPSHAPPRKMLNVIFCILYKIYKSFMLLSNQQSKNAVNHFCEYVLLLLLPHCWVGIWLVLMC